MSKHIYILQNRHETNAPNNIIKKIYDMVVTQERYNGGVYDDETDFIGEITLSAPTYKEWIDKIHTVFPDLIVNSLYYMLFKDSVVEQIMISYLTSKGVGDGHGITYDDAKNKLIVALPSFRLNTNIEYFNELQYFEKITKLSGNTFQGCTNLKEIDLSNITLLENYNHFYGCTNLQKIILGNISTIPGSCFYNCSSLETIENMDNVTTINGAAFRNCILLETIDLSNVITISDEVFRDCLSLSNVNISDVTSIGHQAFRGCTNLTLQSYVLPNLLTVGNNAFEGTAITSLNATNCTTIESGTFYNCNQLTSINLPHCTTIKSSAFMKCTALSIDLNLPSLTTLGNEAFRETPIKSIISLGNTTQILSSTFSRCTSLTTCNNALSNVTSIVGEAFSGCTSLQSVGNLPNLTTIGGHVFSGCSSLTSFDFNTGITSIDNGAFNNCTSLVINDLNLPNLTSLGTEVFKGTKLKNIVSLGNITLIKQGTFQQCTDLTTISNNALLNVISIDKQAFWGCSSLASINLPQTITSIGSSTFSGCTSLVINDLNLPNLISLELSAFYNTLIKEISSLGNLTIIPQEVFRKCNQLIRINNNALQNVTIINQQAFAECTALTDIGNITNLEYIGGQAFISCSSLTTCFDLSHTTFIGSQAFSGCTSVTFKRNSKGCIDLTNVEQIGWQAFASQVILDLNGYIDLGTHLTYIEGAIFDWQRVNLILRCSQVPSHSSGVRHLSPADGYYVYVLDELLDTYKTEMADCANKFKPISELPVELQ